MRAFACETGRLLRFHCVRCADALQPAPSSRLRYAFGAPLRRSLRSAGPGSQLLRQRYSLGEASAVAGFFNCGARVGDRWRGCWANWKLQLALFCVDLGSENDEGWSRMLRFTALAFSPNGIFLLVASLSFRSFECPCSGFVAGEYSLSERSALVVRAL